MPRPPKFRRVGFLPDVTYFKPAGIPLRTLQEVVLRVEELEAIRLKDLEDLEQEACAERMQVSRPTFQRILEAARRKVAEALIQGKAIRVEGGHFRVDAGSLYCATCGFQFSHDETSQPTDTTFCPQCQKPLVTRPEVKGPDPRAEFWPRGWRGRRE